MTQQARALLDFPIQAAGTISPYRFVGFDGAQATVAGQAVVGVSNRSATIAQWTDITIMGTAIVESGGVLAAGNPVATDTLGRAVAAAALTAAGTSLTVAAGATPVTSTAANGAIVAGNSTLAGGVLPVYVAGRVAPGNSAAGAGEFVEVILIGGGG